MKKLLACFLAVIMVFSTVGSVSLAEEGEPIIYEGGSGYSAEKLSNPTLGPKNIDGLINDRGQNYAWSSVGYGENVYVGTCFGAIYQTLRIIAIQGGIDWDVMKKAIDVFYNGTLYNGDEGDAVTVNRSVLVKINTKTGETTIVHGPTTAGGYRAAVEFQDKLYFAATGSTPYLLEVDPATDETQIVCYSEKPQSASISTGIRGLAVYNDQLIATMIGNNGAYMVASSNPSAGQDSFKVIGTQEDFLDYPAYHYMDSIFGGSIWDIIEFNDKLYITVVTGKSGNKQAFALFSGQPDADGNWQYDLIVGDQEDGAEYPFGLGSDRSGAANLMVYDGYLYVGGYNDPMVALPKVLEMDFAELYEDLDSPVCLWRMDENGTFEMIAGEANEVFPEGPSGNMGAGLGSNLNQYVWRMADYDGKLYVGTFDIGSLAYPVMQFTNGDILKMTAEEWESQINYIKILLEALMPEEEIISNEPFVYSVMESESAEEVEDESTEASSESEESTEDESVEEESSEGESVEEESSEDESVEKESSEEESSEEESLEEETSQEDNSAMISTLEEMVFIMEDMAILYDCTHESSVTFDMSGEPISASEAFYALLDMLKEVYEKVKEKLPEEIITELEKILNEEVLYNFECFIGTCKYLSKGERGFDLLVSSDGINFDVITRDGFGDPYNHGCRVFAIADTGLCIGTANPFFGAQVWQLSSDIEYSVLAAAEGTYDKNPESAQHKADVAIDFKGNTIAKIECNYNQLEEGVDYVVTAEGVSFTDSFLSTLDVKDYNFTFFFNVGARGRYVLHVIDTTEEKDDSGNTNQGNTNKPSTNKPSTDKPFNSASSPHTGDTAPIMMYMMLILCSAMVVLFPVKRRKRV